MDKMKMQSMDGAEENIKKLRELFPETVTETVQGGKTRYAVDFGALRQVLADSLADDAQERYRFTWPDKKKAVLLANTPINKTLRPCRAESVDFDSTENLYIEGDNLEALKLLQEGYLGTIRLTIRGTTLCMKTIFPGRRKNTSRTAGSWTMRGTAFSKTPKATGVFTAIG